MRHYLIWMGEKLEKQPGLRNFDWDTIMYICMHEDLGPDYSVEAYLKERDQADLYRRAIAGAKALAERG